MSITYLEELLILGICAGALYGLVAIGYTLVFGVMKVINYSHGDLFALGAYLGYVARTQYSASLITCATIATIGVVGIAIIAERFLLSRLYRTYAAILLIGHIALSTAIRSALNIAFGESFRTYHIPHRTFAITGIPVTDAQITVVTTAIMLALLIWMVINRTSLGIAIRAVAADTEAAIAAGIPTRTIKTTTYAIAAASAGIAGVIGAQITELSPQMGATLGLKAFAASVIGGVGSLWGALAAGILVGILETLIVGTIGGAYRDFFTYGLVLCVLAMRPTGLIRAVTA